MFDVTQDVCSLLTNCGAFVCLFPRNCREITVIVLQEIRFDLDFRCGWFSHFDWLFLSHRVKGFLSSGRFKKMLHTCIMHLKDKVNIFSSK